MKTMRLSRSASSCSVWFEHVGRDDLFQQALELRIGQADPVQRLELLAEITLHRRAVADVRTQRVLELAELFDQLLLDGAFPDLH